MVLWRREGFAEDAWVFLVDDAPAPEGDAIVVSLKRWLAERETLAPRNAPVGVAVEAGADAQAHLPELADRRSWRSLSPNLPTGAPSPMRGSCATGMVSKANCAPPARC